DLSAKSDPRKPRPLPARIREKDDDPSGELTPRKPRPLPARLGEEHRPAPRTVKTPRNPVTSLPPLTTNEPPRWLRHLHWLLVLVLIPLAFSLLGEREGEEEFLKRWAKTLDQAPQEVQTRAEHLLDKIGKGKEVTRDDLIKILPDQKLEGAFLPLNSWAH